VFKDFIQNSVEWNGWGWNSLTISFFATLMFTIIQALGLSKQFYTIYRSASGVSVSAPFFAYFFYAMVSCFFYGIFSQSIALVCNGTLGIFYFLVLFGLWKYKGFTKIEMTLLFLFSLMVVFMIIFPWKDTLFLIFTAGGLVPMANQPIVMWRNKNAGVLDLGFVVVFSASVLFWLIYGLAIKNLALMIINPIALIIMFITILLWLKYKPAH